MQIFKYLIFIFSALPMSRAVTPTIPMLTEQQVVEPAYLQLDRFGKKRYARMEECAEMRADKDLKKLKLCAALPVAVPSPSPEKAPGQRKMRVSTGRSLVGPFPFASGATASCWKNSAGDGITVCPGIYFESLMHSRPQLFVPVDAANCVFLRRVTPDPVAFEEHLKKMQQNNNFRWMLDEDKSH
jgi:hypothetical protein